MESIRNLLSRPSTAHSNPTPISSVSSRKFVPPLLLETRPSLIHATSAFTLHVLALTALLGGTAKSVHFLTNLILTGALDVDVLPWVLATALLCIAVALAVAAAILRSALTAQRDAVKRLHIEWLPDNSIHISAIADSVLPPVLAKLQSIDFKCGGKTAASSTASAMQTALHCVPVSGCYSSHLWVTLALQVHSLPGPTRESKPRASRCYLVLARDSLDNRSFRHLRLWLRIALNRDSAVPE